ncbi:MAG TPA: hypothetical protein VHF01_14485 [Candidatus Acidoferrum sp.]|nr:hypothetical protein [Candidatus Acidoferrum sp.]
MAEATTLPRIAAAQVNLAKTTFKKWRLPVLLTAGAWTLGCGGGGAGSVAPPPPPPPPSIAVTVTPTNAVVVLGNAQSFMATVANTSDTLVTWSVNGVQGGNTAMGTVTADGLYTAPVDMPALPTVEVTATSHADATKSGTAGLTISSDITIGLTPAGASVELGATQAFHAAITSGGHPDSAVRWSVTVAACPSGCGTVDTNGNYTAPQILPQPSSVTLTAQSAADPSKQVSVPVNITSNFSLQLSAPSSVSTGATAAIVATLTPVPGSNPSGVVTWSLSGPGCSGASCGTLIAVTRQSPAAGAITDSATYTAPMPAPNPNTVTITVTPQADPSKRAQATLTVQAGVSVSLSPSTATRAANHSVTLTAQVTGTPNTGVMWSVNGVAGGNSTFGQICAVGMNPCQAITNGNALQVDYLAPGGVPQPNPVTVQATSAADSTKSATAQITVINHVLVTVQPGSVTVAPLAVQGFTATVLGTNNPSVVWQVQGAACTSAGVCGSIDTNGTYTAPNAPPNPNTLQAVAISSDDTSQSGTASVTIGSGADILSLHPASVYAGGAAGFTLRAAGSGFIASSPGPGSVLLIAGTVRTTACNSSTECTAPVTPADVAAAGNVPVQIQNPDGTKSNAVSLVVVAPGKPDEVIALPSASPAATGKDIVVVEPTTAGMSVPGNDVDLNVAALGAFSSANNSCTLAGNPLVLLRPANGTATADVCLFSLSGLDTSMTYIVSGPGDVAVISKQPAGLGIIHLTLQVPAGAYTGARTLFIQNTNLDKTAASGVLEIE